MKEVFHNYKWFKNRIGIEICNLTNLEPFIIKSLKHALALYIHQTESCKRYVEWSKIRPLNEQEFIVYQHKMTNIQKEFPFFQGYNLTEEKLTKIYNSCRGKIPNLKIKKQLKLI